MDEEDVGGVGERRVEFVRDGVEEPEDDDAGWLVDGAVGLSNSAGRTRGVACTLVISLARSQ